MVYTSTDDTGVWHHWAGTYDGTDGSQVLYKDGVEVISRTGAGTGKTFSSTSLFIGKSAYGTTADSFDGSLDEVRLWNTVRTADQIFDNYNRVINDPTSEANLFAYYDFENITADTVTDQSASNITGTLGASGAGGIRKHQHWWLKTSLLPTCKIQLYW